MWAPHGLLRVGSIDGGNDTRCCGRFETIFHGGKPFVIQIKAFMVSALDIVGFKLSGAVQDALVAVWIRQFCVRALFTLKALVSVAHGDGSIRHLGTY